VAAPIQNPQSKIQNATVRVASAADLPAINDIYNFYVDTSPATFDLEHMTESWRRDWFEARTRAGFPVLVADIGGEVAGWCCLSPWSPKKAYARTVDESIYIADASRGRGVGKALLAAVVEEARRLDFHVVMAGIVGCQEASLALHRSLGFVEAGRYAHMGFKLGEWHDVHWYQRHLWQDNRGDDTQT
jgi:phosphinothricin acetyltransferase